MASDDNVLVLLLTSEKLGMHVTKAKEELTSTAGTLQ